MVDDVTFCKCQEESLKIVENLDEYNEGGRDEDWDALKGISGKGLANIKRYEWQTNWSLWEQESDKIDIYSELLKFSHEFHLEHMIDHCIIRLANKILTWSSNDSVDAFADLQRRNAEDSEYFEELVKLAEEVMSRRKE